MLVVAATCVALVVLTTFIHYEVLRALSAGLPKLTIATRAKLIVVIFGTFLAHAAEVLLYALAIYAIARHGGLGSLGEPGPLSLDTFLYFSAETFTSLGYGAEVRWNVNSLRLNGQPLISGHTYRLQFIVHDGDQNKTGGDVGQACSLLKIQ